MLRHLFYPTDPAGSASLGLLAVRIVTGLAFILHGWPKVMREGELVLFTWMGPEVPVPGLLQATAALIEVVGGGLLIVGLLTPAAALAISLVMAVALGMVHLPAGHPFVNPKGASYELAAVYLANSVLLMLAGAGRWSLDAVLFGRQSTRTAAKSGTT